jgi:hypothetical protein
MKEVALTFPNSYYDSTTKSPTPSTLTITPPKNFKSQNFADLGTSINTVLSLVFTIAGILVLVFALWGAFAYILAGGNKEALGKARSRIIWALAGLMILAVTFLLKDYVYLVFAPQDVKIQQVGQ